MSWIRSLFFRLLAWIAKPRMIRGYRLPDGRRLGYVRISTTVIINAAVNLHLEDYVFIWHHSVLDSSAGLWIGEGCQIGAWVGIFTHSSHISIRLYGREYVKEKDPVGYAREPVHIGAYTFIGSHSIILPGSRIGKGCLIAPFSVVRGEFPDFSAIAGNPARVRGDTRHMDEAYLSEHPELRKNYEAWASAKSKDEKDSGLE